MENKKPHAGHRQRLRQLVMENGLQGLHEHQVLEYLLSFVVPQKDTNVLAHDLINQFGGFSNVFEASLEDLQSVKGIGEVVAHFLYSFKDFVSYYKKRSGEHTSIITGPTTAKIHAKKLLEFSPVEEVYITAIDAKNKVLFDKRVSSGNVNQAYLDLRTLTQISINSQAANILLSHNHPKGKARPSVEDDKLTKALFVSLELNNIKLMDHIIVGENDEYSYFADGKLGSYQNYVVGMVDPVKARFNERMGIVSQNYATYSLEEDKNE